MLKPIEKEIARVDDFLVETFSRFHPRLQEIYRHLAVSGGKRLRPAFTLLAGRYGKNNVSGLVPLAGAVEMVHLASLLHDDIIDAAATRREKPTLWALYGNNIALHTGDCLLSCALEIVHGYGHAEINKLLAITCVEMCRGEISEINPMRKLNLSSRDYLVRIKRKTSALITFSFKAGALAGEAGTDIVRILGSFGHNLGMAYQIMDDCMDYSVDLGQGVVTLPHIFASRSGNAAQEERMACIQAREIAARYIEKGLTRLDALPQGDTTDTLRELGYFVRDRSA